MASQPITCFTEIPDITEKTIRLRSSCLLQYKRPARRTAANREVYLIRIVQPARTDNSKAMVTAVLLVAMVVIASPAAKVSREREREDQHNIYSVL